MTASPFATPASTAGINYEEHKGRLLIIEPLRVQKDVVTDYGTKDAVAANVHSLTGPTEADVYEDILIFPAVLQGQVRPKIGEKVLGRLAQGVAKKGQSAPWILEDPTADDIAKGVAYLDHLKATTVSAPASTPAATAESSSAPSDEPATSGSVPF